MLRNSCGQSLHNTSIDVEQIVTSHARLARHSGGDNDEVASLQSLSKIRLASISFQLNKRNNHDFQNQSQTPEFQKPKVIRHKNENPRKKYSSDHPPKKGIPPKKLTLAQVLNVAFQNHSQTPKLQKNPKLILHKKT